ncbi:MAG: hypothetical protein D4S02_13690 [Rhodocyclaceae bacterium]|nr:MAG: hypothetical protein D4S02_13690 [Rhodocyclaceae bacterium]
MTSYESSFVEPLLANRVLGQCSYQSLARVLPHMSERHIEAGAAIFTTGQKAEHLFVIREGNVQLQREGSHPVAIANGLCGEESAIDLPEYLSDAIAITGVSVLAIPKKSARELVVANPSLRSLSYQSLALPGLPLPAAQRSKGGTTQASAGWSRPFGWLTTLVLPALTIWLGPESGLQQNAVLFLAVFVATVCMWVFNLVDEYIPGIFAIFAILILGVAPPSAVLAGFASDGFFLAMSILGLGTVIVASGLSYRFLLWMLLKLPQGERWDNLGLLLTGFLLTPMVPSINGRVALLAPLTIDIVEILHCKPKGKLATGLAITTFTGASLLSAVFLSSKSVNFVIYGLLPTQAQEQFQWLFWFFASAATGAFLIVVYFAIFVWIQRHNEVHVLEKEQVAAQLKLLGPLRNREWSALVGMAVFMLAVVTASLHRIQPPWIAVAILYVLLVYGFLDKKEFKEKIDWPFLVYLAGIVGLVGAFNAVGLDDWLAVHLAGLGSFMRTNFSMFIALLAVVIFVIRLAVPISTTIVITAAVFMPLAAASGINSWIIGFIILVLGEMWYFPYQCSYYIQFRDTLSKSAVYDEKAFLRFNVVMNVAKIAAIYASLPYWKLLGLL